MRLTDASVAIRPRNPWEAIDLGTLMAREHRVLLMSSWAIVTLPIFALLSVIFINHPSVALVVFWWLKPLYERLPLLILSQALFGSTPTLGEALKGWLRILRPQLVASLTWRRFSMSRSFKLPVQQLEGLSGPARQLRIGVLSRGNLRAARWLTSIGGSLETSLWMGLMMIFYLMIPQQIRLDWSWNSVIDIENKWMWLQHLSNTFYVAVLILWGPIYVACGFTLYLNRRTALEAWDVELVLRRLRQRLTGNAYAMLIGVGLALGVVFSMASPSVWADEQSYSCPLPPVEDTSPSQPEAGPEAPRLTHQPLTSSVSRDSIKGLLAQPPFKTPETVSGWRLINDKTATDKQALPAQWIVRLINWAGQAAQLFAQAFKVLLWAAVGIAVGLLIWRYRAWLSTFVNRAQHAKVIQRSVPQQLFGLQVSAESLPDDVASAVERLWPQDPRQALGLLYRALLSKLLIDYRLPLKHADTEGEVLQKVVSLKLQGLSDFSQQLTTHWQNLAYGHQLPAASVQRALCDGWRNVFGGQPSRVSATDTAHE